MSIPTPAKRLQPDNPFLQAQTPILRQRSSSASTPLKPLPKGRAAITPFHAAPQANLESCASTTKTLRQHAPGKRLNPKNLALGFAIVMVLFCLLPETTQQKAFRKVGLGIVESKALLSVPIPVHYHYVSSPFGKRWGKRHQGIDLAAPTGAPIYAASAGTVLHSGWEAGYGNSVVIDHHNGTQTRYAHCARTLAKAGAVVLKGQHIAEVGSTGHSTGPHLHFEVIANGVRQNPAWYYRFEKAPQLYVQNAQAGQNWLQAFSKKLNRWLRS